MGYTKDAIRGVSWIWGIRIITRAIVFIKTIIVARILTPSQFGVFGIATIAIASLEVFTETGINIFLIQQKEAVDEYVSTAWIVSILRGVIIAGIVLITAPIISSFFHSGEAYRLLLLISIVPLIRGFINPAVARFLKELEFNKEFYYRTSVFAVEVLFTIVFVILYHSAMALVLGLICGAIFEVFFSFFIAQPRPYLHFKKATFLRIISEGKWLTAAGIFNYLYHNVDTIVVGKMLGTASLGLYDMAYTISTLPISEVSDVISQVTLPVYVKMTTIHQLKTAFLKSAIVASIIVIPAGMVFFLFPELIIKIILGNQWISAAPALRILAIFGVIRSISNTSNAVFYAQKKQNIVAHATLFSLLGLAITIVPFVTSYGLVGAGLSALCGAIASLPVIFYSLNQLFQKKV